MLLAFKTTAVAKANSWSNGNNPNGYRGICTPKTVLYSVVART